MSVRSLNKVMLIGNLTRDPELRYTPAGTAVVSFGLATNRGWTTESGEKREETEFHRIVAWNKLAELCSQLLTKGRKVFVEGRLQTRSWQGQDGRERQSTEIVIDDMIILDPRRPDMPGMPVNTTTAPATSTHQAGATQAPPVSAVSDSVMQHAVSGVSAVTDPVSSTPKSTVKTDDVKTEEVKKKEKPEVREEENKEDINPDDIPF